MKWGDKKVSIIILVMNEYYYLKRCLNSLAKYTNNFELILVLNNASDNVKNYVSTLTDFDMTVIDNKQNMGFPYGCNQGIKVAKYDLLMFLNADTVVTPNWLNILKRCFDDIDDAGIAAPYTSIAGSNGQQIDILLYRRFMLTDKQIENIAEIVNLKEDYWRCSVIGFCFLVKREVIDKIGVFDWHTWKLGNEEEVEFQWRARKLANYYAYHCRGCYVHHFGNVAWKTLEIDQVNYNIELRKKFRDTKDTSYNYKFIENDVKIPGEELENTKIKIAWIADFLIENYRAGGAQYTNDRMIREGKKRGYEIIMVTPDKVSDEVYDLYIVNNIRNFETDYLLDIINNRKYIKWEHDYWVVGTKGEKSPLLKLLDNSLINLFMSKLQIEECERRMNMKIPRANYILSPIDTDTFFMDASIKKDKNLAIWTGHDIPDNKGFIALLNYAKQRPELKIKAFGKFKKYNNKNTPTNVEIIGEVFQKDFADWLKKAQYVIALPNWIEPTGRSIMEGLLCGCTLIVNNNIGFLHEDIDFSDYEQVKNAVQTEGKFWDLIEGVV